MTKCIHELLLHLVVPGLSRTLVLSRALLRGHLSRTLVLSRALLRGHLSRTLVLSRHRCNQTSSFNSRNSSSKELYLCHSRSNPLAPVRTMRQLGYLPWPTSARK